MKEPGHTPGPWSVIATDEYGTYHIQEAAYEQEEWIDEGYADMETDEELAEGKRRNEIAMARDEGNRRLIEVAPVMLEALEEIAEKLHDMQCMGLAVPTSRLDSIIDIAIAAIAKQEG